jgi:hypothetical protein
MVFVYVFQQIADSPSLFRMSVALFAVAQIGMHVVGMPLRENYPGGWYAPDLHVFGYTSDELNRYYDTVLGDARGCEHYIAVAEWDFFPYMIAYTLLLGSALIRAARTLRSRDDDAGNGGDEHGSAGSDNKNDSSSSGDGIANLVVLACTFDLVETYVQRRGCQLYISDRRSRLDEHEIRCASVAVQCKWALLGVANVVIAMALWKTAWRRHRRRCDVGEGKEQQRRLQRLEKEE